jgi:hypothetical protein
VFGETRSSAAMQTIDAGFAISFEADAQQQTDADFLQELNFFAQNWILAYSALCIQEDVAYQRVLSEYQRRMRIEAIENR